MRKAMLQTFTIVGLLVLLLLVITLVFCPSAEAQTVRPEIGGYPVVKQGDLTHWCSDLLCSGAGTARATGKVPAAPCDPWADDGIFNDQNPTDVACIRRRYGRPPGPNDHQLSWYGSWFAQHGSEGASMEREWEARFPGAVSDCLSRGNAAAARGYCDAYHTGGATLGCVVLSCGWTSCPSFPRTCPAGGGSTDGYHRGPLLSLPEAHRPPNTRGWPQTGARSLPAGPADACAWVSAHARLTTPTAPYLYLVRPPRAECCEGMPASCCTPVGLVPECWAPPAVCGDGDCAASEIGICAPDCGVCGDGIEFPGECPAECPEDCAPPEPGVPTLAIVVELPPPGSEIWIIRWIIEGGEPGLTTATNAAPLEIEHDGDLLLRLTLPAPLLSECPAAGVLEALRAIEGVCQ